VIVLWPELRVPCWLSFSSVVPKSYFFEWCVIPYSVLLFVTWTSIVITKYVRNRTAAEFSSRC
jgi:hypothetical protein